MRVYVGFFKWDSEMRFGKFVEEKIVVIQRKITAAWLKRKIFSYKNLKKNQQKILELHSLNFLHFLHSKNLNVSFVFIFFIRKQLDNNIYVNGYKRTCPVISGARVPFSTMKYIEPFDCKFGINFWFAKCSWTLRFEIC